MTEDTRLGADSQRPYLPSENVVLIELYATVYVQRNQVASFMEELNEAAAKAQFRRKDRIRNIFRLTERRQNGVPYTTVTATNLPAWMKHLILEPGWKKEEKAISDAWDAKQKEIAEEMAREEP